jgi:hypothetical protein
MIENFGILYGSKFAQDVNENLQSITSSSRQLQAVNCIYKFNCKNGKSISTIKLTGKEMLIVVQVFPVILQKYVVLSNRVIVTRLSNTHKIKEIDISLSRMLVKVLLWCRKKTYSVGELPILQEAIFTFKCNWEECFSRSNSEFTYKSVNYDSSKFKIETNYLEIS